MREDNEKYTDPKNAPAEASADGEKDLIGEILNEVHLRQARESGKPLPQQKPPAPAAKPAEKKPLETETAVPSAAEPAEKKPFETETVVPSAAEPAEKKPLETEIITSSAEKPAEEQPFAFVSSAPEEGESSLKEVPAREGAQSFLFDAPGDAMDFEDSDPEERPMHLNKKKKIIIACAGVVAAAAIVVGLLFGLGVFDEPETTAPTTPSETTPVTEAAPALVNPLTGEGDYNAAAVGKRPVACVIENSRAARPQWGITTPDMIVEGEVEGGATRMLWFYSDYTDLPDQIGPVRSARPSYVKFSELFDAIFIHWGGSHSRESYTGGYETIEADNVDHLDGISGNGAFGRDRSRGGAVEHSGVLYGTKLVDAIGSKGFRTDLGTSSFSQFAFRETAGPAGTEACKDLTIQISSNCAEDKVLHYDADAARYVNTANYGTQVSFKNVLVLYLDSSYTTVSYKGSTETYLDYDLAGTGPGNYASEGTITTIQWAIEDGKLELLDEQGAELQLNPGDTYIALASANHGGEVTFE